MGDRGVSHSDCRFYEETLYCENGGPLKDEVSCLLGRRAPVDCPGCPSYDPESVESSEFADILAMDGD
jgi:hypothetical protein